MAAGDPPGQRRVEAERAGQLMSEHVLRAKDAPVRAQDLAHEEEGP